MFVRSTRLNLMLSALFIVAMGCGGVGSGCGACGSTQPLPGGRLPADQTVEGGAQIRVTQAGFAKLTSILPGLLNSSFAGGFCVPSGSIGGFAASADYCYTTQGTCAPGCRIGVQLNTPNGISVAVTNNQTLRVTVAATVSTSLPIRGRVLGISVGSCTLAINSPNLAGSVDIAFGIRPSDGELTLQVANINNFQLNMNINGCGILGDIADIAVNLLDDIINSFVGNFVLDLLTPAVNGIIQGLLPSPLGIAGMMDVGNMLEGISPGTEGLLEARIVPGGYVKLDSSLRGMSLGVITGMNADEDIATRTGMRPDGVPFASEPSLCVPPIPTPQFGSPPANLPITSRTTYALNPAGAFDGMPEPAADLAMGISETFLDLAGHHLVTSGGMCLGVGTSYINQLNVGTIGILVPSLGELTSDTGRDPLLMVTRPQKALDFTIGSNTPTSPALTIGIHNMEVDFYAFLYERYVRAFTLELTMNIGVNLEFEQMPGMPAVIKPTLIGISASSVQLKVLNSEFVRETPQMLEAVLPSVFDLVTPLLGSLPAIDVPTFAGFTLNNLSIQKVTTSQDDFLALYATLGASTLMRQLGQEDVFAKAAVFEMDQSIGSQPKQSNGASKLMKVVTPEPERVRRSLMKLENGALPEVTFQVDRYDSSGRELEWAYNLNNGMYHPYQTVEAGSMIIRDRAFAWQGKYNVGLKSRVKGDYRTVSYDSVTPVIIDSVGPKILTAKMFWDEDTLKIPMFDIVSEHTLTYAFGKPGDDEPSTEWFKGGTAELSRSQIDSLIVNDEILVFSKDENGITTIAMVAPFHGQSGSSGCACQTSGVPSAGGVALVLFVGLVVFGRRGRTRKLVAMFKNARLGRFATQLGLWLGASIVISMTPGCSCGDPAEKSCEVAADCGADFCAEGELAYCIDNTCVCSDDIPPGKIGPYSDVAAGKDGSIWVSAYAQSHGDLVVARAEPGRIPVESWEWVDGVPDGPVTIPDSNIRGGIEASGEDVGMYTSIAVGNDGSPMVTYFDRETSSLKFAQKVGDVWQKHTISKGTGKALGEQGELIGMYSSLTLRSDDGRPGVAYLVHVRDATNGARAQVRYASAQTTTPTTPADWQIWTVDSAPLPASDPANPNIYPLPEGLGLFVDSARMPNQAPVVVYYDRSNGDLKMSKFNVSTGQFATPVRLDGANVDAGWSPSIAIGADGVVHVAYVGSTQDDLKYITDAVGAMPQIVDDGYRLVGQTVDGLPKPEFHFVGDDAALVLANGTLPMIAYQDATTQELLLATKQSDGRWTHIAIAGAGDPWPGGYGFFASSSLRPTELVMSTWVINQPSTSPFENNWVEVFTRPTVIQ